jgi:hypothetical protein
VLLPARGTVLPARLQLAGEDGQHRIVPQVFVVDQVLVAEGDPEHPLADQGRHLVLDALRRPCVAEARRERTKPMAQSVAPSSSAPASEVMTPPSKPATTARLSTGANSNSVGLHSVGIGGLLCVAVRLCRRRTFADSEPRCTYRS